jgi:hypothetical protein
MSVDQEVQGLIRTVEASGKKISNENFLFGFSFHKYKNISYYYISSHAIASLFMLVLVSNGSFISLLIYK